MDEDGHIRLIDFGSARSKFKEEFKNLPRF